MSHELGARFATLRIDQSEVTFSVGGSAHSQPTGGLTLAARERLRELEEPLADQSPEGSDSDPQTDDAADALRKAGLALGMSFLEGPAGMALSRELDAAQAAGTQLRLSIDAGDDFADLPWEILVLPEICDPSPERRPLGLDPRIAVCRTAGSPSRPAHPSRSPAGPLSIVAAIGCPERAGMVLLNYEEELRTILDAVSYASKDSATDVRVLNWGTVEAIRAALTARPAHILHISCHADPGHLCLETAAGDEDLVDAARIRREIIPDGSAIPPLVVLAGCSTGRSVRDGADGALPGLARELVLAGVPAVIAMTASVLDDYATRFTGELYERLAAGPTVDVLSAFTVVRQLLAEEVAEPPGVLPQWRVPAIFLRDPERLTLGGRDSVSPSPTTGPQPRGPVAGADYASYFVGRRAELRDILTAFQAGAARILVCGVAGIGKTSFVNAALALLGGAAGIPVRVSTSQRPEQVVTAIVRAVRESGPVDARLLDQVDSAIAGGSLRWADGLARVREVVLARQAVLLVLEVSDANLVADGGSHLLAHPEFAVFLAAWVSSGAGACLLASSPHPFVLPGGPASQPALRFLGLLSGAEADKLAFQLPAVRAKVTDKASEQQLRRLSGHPRALVRLNSLAAENAQRDLAEAVTDVISKELEAIAFSALRTQRDLGDSVLRLVTRASVYRFPVSLVGLNWQLADSLEPAADAGRVARLAEALETADAGGFRIRQVSEDLAEQRRPADDPRLGDVVREAMERGLVSGPFNPDDMASARFHVPAFVVEAIRPQADPSDITEAHSRAGAYWRWEADRDAALGSHNVTDMRRYLQAFNHLSQGRDKAASLEVAAEIIPSALVQGADGAEIALTLGTMLAENAADPSRELCGARLVLGIAYWLIGDRGQSVGELSAAIAMADAIGDDTLVVTGTGTLVKQLLLTGQDAELLETIIADAGEAAERADDDILRATVLMMRAHAAIVAGDPEEAVASARQALSLLPPLASHPLIRVGEQFELALVAETLRQSATAARMQKEGNQSATRGMLALDTEFAAHNVISSASVMLGRIDDADHHADQAMEVADTLPYGGMLAKAYQLKGMVYLARNELGPAERMYRASLSDRTADQAGTRATAYGALAEIAMSQGNMTAAAERLEKAVSAAEEFGNAALAGFGCGARAALAIDLQDGTADEWLARAAASGTGDHPLVQVTTTLAASQRKLAESDYEAARELAEEALSLAKGAGFRQQAMQALRLLAYSAILADDEDTAERAYTELAAATESSGDKMSALLLLTFQLEIGMEAAWTEEDWDDVEECAREALRLAEELEAYHIVAGCLESLITISAERGRNSRDDTSPGDMAGPARRLTVVSQKLGIPDGVLRSIEGHMLAAFGQEDLTTFREQLQWHHAYTDGTPDESRSLIFDGLLYSLEDQDDPAEDAFRRALTIAENAHDHSIAAFAADLLAELAEQQADLPTAQAYLRKTLSYSGPDDDRFPPLLRMREVSLKRAACDPGYRWPEALLDLGESADDPLLRAGCYQMLGMTAADEKNELQAEDWLKKALDLWGESAGRDHLLGRSATRHRIVRMISRNPDRWEEGVNLLGRNVAEALRDGHDVYFMDKELLLILRDGLPRERFLFALSPESVEQAAILREIGGTT